MKKIRIYIQSHFPDFKKQRFFNALIVVYAFAFYNVSFAQGNEDGVVEKVFDAIVNDSIAIDINLSYNKEVIPEYYFSSIVTPVCKDGLCYLMVVDVYWDLLGNFHQYEVPENHPLTKFDHVEFSERDHEKMAEILSNKDSFLRHYSLENLIDTKEQRQSNLVDGVSAATHKSIQSDVVEGAVFSTYVLWHIVNGSVADRILEYTETRFNESLMVHFLQSSNPDYQYYGLNRITAENQQEYLDYIIRLIAEGSDYVPYFAIEKLTQADWESPKTQVEIVKLLGEVNFEMENELLNRIKEVLLSESTIEILVSKFGSLREGQQIKAASILKNNHSRISNKSRSILAGFADHPNKGLSEQIVLLLEGSESIN